MRQKGREDMKQYVALFTRAWIEILGVPDTAIKDIRRPLYEGVD